LDAINTEHYLTAGALVIVFIGYYKVIFMNIIGNHLKKIYGQSLRISESSIYTDESTGFITGLWGALINKSCWKNINTKFWGLLK
jgi:hypothetical protein